MLKKIILLLAIAAGAVQAQTTTPTADAHEWRQRNPANNGTIIYYVVPDGAVDQLPLYDGTANGPVYLKLGTGLIRSSTTLTISPAANQISDSTSVGRAVLTATDAAAARSAIGVGASFSGSYADLTGIPSTFAPSAHTHVATDISDSTSIGRAVLTASTAANARTAIGAGTSSFDGAYASLSGIPATFAPATHTQAWSTITSTPTTLTGYGITDGVRSVTAGTGLSGGTITGTGTISMPNTGTAGTYSGVTTDAQGRVTAGTARSFAYQTRALNTCFQVSGTRDALATYSVDISTTLSLAGGAAGTVYLRIYTNNTCTTGTQEVSRFVNGNTGSLTIGLNITQNVTGTLTGVIPANTWAQLVTENTTGSPNFTARPGQEVLL